MRNGADIAADPTLTGVWITRWVAILYAWRFRFWPKAETFDLQLCRPALAPVPDNVPGRSISQGSAHTVAALFRDPTCSATSNGSGFPRGFTVPIGNRTLAWPFRAISVPRYQRSAGGIPWRRPVCFPTSRNRSLSRRSGSWFERSGSAGDPSLRSGVPDRWI